MKPLCTELTEGDWKAVLETCLPPCLSSPCIPLHVERRSFGLLPSMHLTVPPSVKIALEQGNSKVSHNLS